MEGVVWDTGGVRLIASDIDGTLLAEPHPISPRVVAALAAAHRSGVEIVPVTGRPLRWLPPVLAQLPPVGAVICSNGAVVLDGTTGAVERHFPLDARALRTVIDRLEARLPEVRFGYETLDGLFREPDFPARRPDDSRIASRDQVFSSRKDVVKVLARAPGHGADELLRLASVELDGVAQPTHANAADDLLEIATHGLTKARTLAEVCAARGIAAADVVAFGDMPNDLELLGFAGRGYAMADGHPVAVAAASHVAPAMADDGVAIIIEELLDSAHA